MNIRNGSIKFWNWQNEKMILLAIFAPILYTIFINLIDGKLTSLISNNLTYMYVMFSLIIIITYGTSIARVVAPLAISMGATRKETVTNIIYTNVALFVQLFLAVSVVEVIMSGGFKGVGRNIAIVGVLLFAATWISNFISGVMITNKNNVVMIIILVSLIVTGTFSAGFMAAFSDDNTMKIIVEISPYLLIAATAVSVVLYICSIYFIAKKMKNYEVRI